MNRFNGVYAALLTPRNDDGELNLPSYRHQVEVLKEKGLSGYAINGATGEFTSNSEEELRLLLQEARSVAPNMDILCGVGAADTRGSIRRTKVAATSGASGILLPMPYFFPYRQDDLREFIHAVASETELPILLYNLPQFTSGLDTDTVLTLLREHNNIQGIKDSSGSLEIVRAITRENIPATRLIGNDSALCDALSEGVCDGVVSGVACALPELMLSLFFSDRKEPNFGQLRGQLELFIHKIGPLPTPWGLKVASAVRGFTEESYPLPLSPQRKQEAEQLREWFTKWFSQELNQK
ncbi:dihydrodipicolinate synthase family protein [Edaphobacter albus]|uniref:dihydrodipicolinate synthase family protein n=1 Tax=Edaphobacter sp. 4G125 TaxID=2763071 RepID=UPI0016466BCC|nr:dihydrodipicolinate synthase family protein [Edaphobacter sp. 4G125]QNI38224.1 dihydrodipicolinate synthase family protein [Edaphobacter sp. 4G125]